VDSPCVAAHISLVFREKGINSRVTHIIAVGDAVLYW